MPMSADFQRRIAPHLKVIAERFGTPFHIYDELGIRQTCRKMIDPFRDAGLTDYRNFDAVKALPNPAITKILAEEGMGFDCSSVPELRIARSSGARSEDIMFTSNNTEQYEFLEALKDGCILNLDDISLVNKVPDPFPKMICFRYNPGERRSTSNDVIGQPKDAKYGVPHEQIKGAYRLAMARGANRFGLHTMLVSNERNADFIVETARMLLDLASEIGKEFQIKFKFINIGGGFGIPYHPDAEPLDLDKVVQGIAKEFRKFESANNYRPTLFTECGRYVTGPHGILVTRVINNTNKYQLFSGVDACSTALMRPLMYKAYHHITVAGKENEPMDKEITIHGSICEGIDRFNSEPRLLPKVDEGDLIIIHDTGAHGLAMGFNYNGRLRPQELLLCQDGTVRQIRRAETVEDLFATLQNVNAMPLQLTKK